MASSLGADLRALLRTLSTGRRRQLMLLAALMPATAVAEMAMVAAIVPFLAVLSKAPVTDQQITLLARLLRELSVAPTSPLLAAATLFALAVMVTGLLRLALSWLSQQFAFGLGHELDVELQRRMLHQPYLFHLRHHSSELLAALDKVDFLVFSTALQGIQAISAALVCLLVVAVLLWIDPVSATLAALFVGGLYSLALMATRHRLASHAAVIRGAFQARLKAAQDSLGGIRDIILDRSQDVRVEHFRKIDSRFKRARADAAFLVAAPRILVEALGLVLIALLAVTIAGRPGGLAAALPILGALALGAQRLLPLTSQLHTGWANLIASRPIIRELAELTRLPLEEGAESAVPPIPFAQSIRFDKVSFHYAERAQPALYDISLTIPKGARVALTGRSGSGKSTLADLLMGLIDPTAGRIMIDDWELSGPRLAGWRRSIAHVPQAIFLSDDSIAANIALAAHEANIDMDRVRRAADIAHLTDFVATLADGFETRVGERGARLSGGQRQRLGLARAIYKDAPVLVLDEATSALDEQTERAVMDALDALQADGTTIVTVSHRPSSAKGCDLIIRLDHGRLVNCEMVAPAR